VEPNVPTHDQILPYDILDCKQYFMLTVNILWSRLTSSNEERKHIMKIVKGNLLDMFDDGEFDMIVHGCNCICVMGGGIAAQVRARYPGASIVDEEFMVWNRPDEKLGKFSIYDADGGNGTRFIVNAYTQLYPAKSNTDKPFSYDAFASVLEKLIEFAEEEDQQFRIGFPRIGSGLAGGNAAIIQNMIEEILVPSSHFDVTIVDYGG